MDKFIKPFSTSVIGDENMMDLQTMANGRGLSGERGREELVCLDGWRLPRRHKRTSDGKREGGESSSRLSSTYPSYLPSSGK